MKNEYTKCSKCSKDVLIEIPMFCVDCTKEIIKETFKEYRKEIEAILPISCVKCKHRSIDGAPESIPICNHPKHKTMQSMYIINYHKPPLKRPSECPLMKKLKPKKFV